MTKGFTGLTDDQLLAEIEEVIRSMPDKTSLHHHAEASWSWLARAVSVLHHWNLPYGIEAATAVANIQSGRLQDGNRGLMRLMVLLRQAAHDLRIRTVGPVNVAVGQGEVFRYFDVLRQIIESADARPSSRPGVRRERLRQRV